MGRSKVLLSVGHQTLLSYQVEQFQILNSPIYVVLGHQALQVQSAHSHLSGIHWILNSDYEMGMSTSVKAGFRAISSGVEAIFLTPVDHLTHYSVIEKLKQAYQRNKTLITSPMVGGKKGHPLILHHSLIPEILKISEDRQGLREVVHRHREDIQTVKVNWLGAKLDLDTPEDYQRMLTFLRRKGLTES